MTISKLMTEYRNLLDSKNIEWKDMSQFEEYDDTNDENLPEEVRGCNGGILIKHYEKTLSYTPKGYHVVVSYMYDELNGSTYPLSKGYPDELEVFCTQKLPEGSMHMLPQDVIELIYS